MLFNKVLVLFASVLTVAASPIAEADPLPVPEAEPEAETSLNLLAERDYTCGQAYKDCQGSGRGQWVCWADKKTKTCGKWSGSQMKAWGTDSMSKHCKGVAYCCPQDATVNLDLDINVLGLINIDIELMLAAQCKGGYQMWHS